MSTTVIWTTILGANVAVHIHRADGDGLAGRYAVSRLWPDCQPRGYWCMALWPARVYDGDCPVVCLDDDGNVITEAAWRAARHAHFEERLARLLRPWVMDEDAARVAARKMAA
jgi:hypothetical protein